MLKQGYCLRRHALIVEEKFFFSIYRMHIGEGNRRMSERSEVRQAALD
jgi:hypothetical protein